MATLTTKAKKAWSDGDIKRLDSWVYELSFNNGKVRVHFTDDEVKAADHQYYLEEKDRLRQEVARHHAKAEEVRQ